MTRISERGNAILISTIMVFALTMTALGVSRLLVSRSRQLEGTRQFLGTQAFTFAEGAILAWIKDLPAHAPGLGSYVLTTYALATVFPGPPALPASRTGSAPITATAVGGGDFRLDIAANLNDTTVGFTTTRLLSVRVTPNGPEFRILRIENVGSGP